MRGGGMKTKKLTVTTVHTGLTTLGSHDIAVDQNV